MLENKKKNKLIRISCDGYHDYSNISESNDYKLLTNINHY